MINLWPLLLPAAAWSGFWMASRNVSHKNARANNRLSHEYVVGLNYLLNEEPDKAVDVFIKLLDVDSDTVETHLALGSLFRRRGEVDRAIRIHQNLIARPQLSQEERREALIALGLDYLSAGVFDRAERIFLEAMDEDNSKDSRSLYGLLAIYEEEKAWENALNVLQKLELTTRKSFNIQAAHYHCEMADVFIKTDLIDKARQAVKQAHQIDPQSVRASLIQASLYMMQRRYKAALEILKKVPHQDKEFLSEIIEPVVHCYRELSRMEECVEFLLETLDIHPVSSSIFVIADFFREQKGMDAAIDFVSEKLKTYSSIRGLNRLIFWHLESTHGKVRDKLRILYDITSKFLDNKPVYRCGQCGFGGKHLHWHCPSCKQWGRMKPVHGLEGD